MTAALDPSLWIDVLGKTRTFIGGWAIALSWKDAVAKSGGSFFQEGGQHPYYHRLYFEKYIKLDPFTTTQFVVDIEEPKSFLEVMPYTELIQTRMYKEWARLQGIVGALMCLIDKTATSVGFWWYFAMSRIAPASSSRTFEERSLSGKSSIKKKRRRHLSPTLSTASAPGCSWSKLQVTSCMPLWLSM
jgi:hypothetical protein